ncbi:hypothetical protein [Bradyrhizobium sp.]|uniref:hypothetical protein n=1 Tax=Bradyrhizobium sp. TaxID=376 RepID=UPI003C6F1CDE
MSKNVAAAPHGATLVTVDPVNRPRDQLVVSLAQVLIVALLKKSPSTMGPLLRGGLSKDTATEGRKSSAQRFRPAKTNCCVALFDTPPSVAVLPSSFGAFGGFLFSIVLKCFGIMAESSM